MFSERPEAWQRGIRKVALIVFVFSMLASIRPFRTLYWTISDIRAKGAPWWQVAPSSLLGVLLSAVLPIFFFGLYRDNGTLRISQTLKYLSLAGAFVYAVFLFPVVRVQSNNSDIGAFGLLDGRFWTFSHITGLFATVSDVTLIILLLMLFLQPSSRLDPGSEIPSTFLLDQVTKIAVWVYGAGLAFNILRTIMTPYTYSVLQSTADANGVTMPPFSLLFWETVRDLLTYGCLFIPPFVVLKSRASLSIPRTDEPETAGTL